MEDMYGGTMGKKKTIPADNFFVTRQTVLHALVRQRAAFLLVPLTPNEESLAPNLPNWDC
jgi:hypothetical protein